MTETTTPQEPEPEPEQAAEQAADGAPAAESRETARLTRSIRSFADTHGGSAEGQISYLGARGYRLVLVGADGDWGDLVAARREQLASAAGHAGVALQENFDGELAARVRTGRYEWSRMAGVQLGGAANG